MTEPHVGYSKDQIAQAVLDTELDATPANAVVIDAVARFCPQSDQHGQDGEMHDVFIVTSEGSDGEHIARTVYAASEDDAPVNAVVIDAVAKFCPQSDQRGQEGEMHDVFIVISEGSDGEHIARTVHAASEDDARQAHQENHADETIVAVHQ